MRVLRVRRGARHGNVTAARANEKNGRAGAGGWGGAHTAIARGRLKNVCGGVWARARGKRRPTCDGEVPQPGGIGKGRALGVGEWCSGCYEGASWGHAGAMCRRPRGGRERRRKQAARGRRERACLHGGGPPTLPHMAAINKWAVQRRAAAVYSDRRAGERWGAPSVRPYDARKSGGGVGAAGCGGGRTLGTSTPPLYRGRHRATGRDGKVGVTAYVWRSQGGGRGG